jgi:hypothetical protein
MTENSSRSTPKGYPLKHLEPAAFFQKKSVDGFYTCLPKVVDTTNKFVV